MGSAPEGLSSNVVRGGGPHPCYSLCACAPSGASAPGHSFENGIPMRAKSAVVLGAQWGDEGKGKIVDVLSERFSAVARYAGGRNAGHTGIIHGQEFGLQLIPCGVLRPGCNGVIGNGGGLEPVAVLGEGARQRDRGGGVD